MNSVRKRLIRVVALCAILAAVAPLPVSAAPADQPTTTVACWVTLLNDLYDGTISNIYPIHCYGEAISHLPAVAQIYGSAKEDIITARQAALLGKLPPGHPVTTTSSSSSKGGLTGFLDRLVPGNPNSFPTPLLILGLLAIVLILAGVGGMLWQRSHPRDDGDDGDDTDADTTPRQLGP